MSLVKSVPNVKRIEVAHVPTVGYLVIKNDDAMMPRHYVGQPTDRMTAIANTVKLAASTGWALNVNLENNRVVGRGYTLLAALDQS